MLTTLQSIGITLGILVAILGLSAILAWLQIDYGEPWMARKRLAKRLRGMHIVTISGDKAPWISHFHMIEHNLTPHWFTSDVAMWLVDNVQGRYGCVPLSGFARYGDARSYYFERVDDAMMFKMRWG